MSYFNRLLESKGNFHLVLASASPRRAELLRGAGLTFRIHPSTFEEDLRKDQPAGEYALATAVAKGQDVYSELGGDNLLVLAADTVVEGRTGEIWEKPADAAEARSMLMSLSGRSHNVHTGVALIHKGGAASFVVTTTVKFVELDDLVEAVDEYIASGSPMDKAGGYGIQDAWMVDSIEGDYFNVVGLPIAHVLRAMKELCN